MIRSVQPELLDRLPAADPAAHASRHDLARLNRLMGHHDIIARELKRAFGLTPPRRIVDLGGGDGTFLLQLARRLAPRWANVETVLVDQHSFENQDIAAGLQQLRWRPYFIQSDALDWLSNSQMEGDVLICNLFLHHFEPNALRRILHSATRHTHFFIACDPRRTPFSLFASRCLWLIGCNRVTRHDAVRSVQAGFTGQELSEIWPDKSGWQLEEKEGGLFSHSFVATRTV